MYYGLYKNLRDGVWNCFLDFNITSLPVDILSIAKKSGVRVVKNSQAKALADNEHGKSFFDGDCWYIIYDDTLDVPDARFTIAHELGHILLGHELALAKYIGGPALIQQKPRSEEHADMFAVRLLCPACILWGLDLHDAADIAHYCKAPLTIAKQRQARMKILYERNKFLTSKLEQSVYEKFKGYIDTVRRNGR